MVQYLRTYGPLTAEEYARVSPSSIAGARAALESCVLEGYAIKTGDHYAFRWFPGATNEPSEDL
jgi:hypothetical protein